MRRGYTMLALGVVLLVGSACRAGEIGVCNCRRTRRPQRCRRCSAGANARAEPAGENAGDGAGAGPGDRGGVRPLRRRGSCCGCGHPGGHCHFESPCRQRLGDWLTYCPPKVPCHLGCCGGCGHKCTPCCMPPYMYFLDRCSCTLGYHGAPGHPPIHAPGPDEDAEPAGRGGSTGSSYGAGATAGR